MKAYYVEQQDLIRVFDYPPGFLVKLAKVSDNPIRKDADLGCIELPGPAFRSLFVTADADSSLEEISWWRRLFSCR